MKIWVDDVRPAPDGYDIWCKSVNRAKQTILRYSSMVNADGVEEDWIELIDIDHDAGDYAQYGGDYIKLLDWLEKWKYNYPIRIHSMNPVGVANMRAIIQKNGWREVF